MPPRKQMGLGVLHDSGASIADLVLIHGLNGDAVGSWTHTDGDKVVVWPRDLLPKKQPKIRVLSYGYPGDIYGNKSVAGIREHAKTLLTLLDMHRDDMDPARPIVFLAHCLGGLIAKQALCFCNHEREYASIASATRSVLFFGTPHFGSDEKQWLSIAEAFAPMGKGQVANIIRAIERNSRDLAEISEDFTQIAPNYTIATFHETRPLKGTTSIIVDKMSTHMFVDSEKSVAVDADHVSMCQFQGMDDPAFFMTSKLIADALKTGASEPTPGQVSALATPPRRADMNQSIIDMIIAQGRSVHIGPPTRWAQTADGDVGVWTKGAVLSPQLPAGHHGSRKSGAVPLLLNAPEEHPQRPWKEKSPNSVTTLLPVDAPVQNLQRPWEEKTPSCTEAPLLVDVPVQRSDRVWDEKSSDLIAVETTGYRPERAAGSSWFTRMMAAVW